jgi:16S rRNA (guanine527-N7)-methyltransferase
VTLPSGEVLAFLERCGLDPKVASPEAMRRLYADLVEGNRATNLTRITSPDGFWTLHVADSLSVGLVEPDVLRGPLHVADVGCGAGFPLLPLAWANPSGRFFGVESRGRKADFVQQEIDALNFPNCRIIHVQVREAARMADLAGRFDLVLLRAVGPAGRLLRECHGLLKWNPGAKIILYKTPSAVEEECRLAEREATKLGLSVTISEPFSLPEGGGDRQFIIIAKT